MQYMLLIYDDPNVWAKMPPEEMQSYYGEYAAVAQDGAVDEAERREEEERRRRVRRFRPLVER
jgi:hypothetical protein